MDYASTPAHELITSERDGKYVRAQLCFKEDSNSLSLLRLLNNGYMYLEDSVIYALSNYSSTAEEVVITIFLPSLASQHSGLNAKLPKFLSRVVSTLNTFTNLKSLKIAFELDTDTFEWNQFKHSAVFYDLEFQEWKLWLNVAKATKAKVFYKGENNLCGWTQILSGSRMERRLAGQWRGWKVLKEKKAQAKKETPTKA
ncbi:hypothetical protein HYFRA_00011127 [Hymenoscyphus fraxineus]|uniref:Uncharacterized protein n=1 Tax=Hymenoscyphus fraxineus TaxID=746836 RepID=A0A9N9L1G7_9HELO|nr:hypothetical protein HYFRA_00011127 [Hymenoscyphus fraxineus]